MKKLLANIYLLKITIRNNRKKCEVCSKLTIKVDFGVFIINFKHVSHFFSSVSIVDFRQTNVSWVVQYL